MSWEDVEVGDEVRSTAGDWALPDGTYTITEEATVRDSEELHWRGKLKYSRNRHYLGYMWNIPVTGKGIHYDTFRTLARKAMKNGTHKRK